MDYLPADAREQEREREVFDVISTTATMVNKEERTLENTIKLKNALSFLENKCHISFKPWLLAPEQKEALVSKLYWLGNQVTMQFGKRSSDNLVMYMDYINWNHKVYRRA